MHNIICHSNITEEKRWFSYVTLKLNNMSYLVNWTKSSLSKFICIGEAIHSSFYCMQVEKWNFWIFSIPNKVPATESNEIIILFLLFVMSLKPFPHPEVHSSKTLSMFFRLLCYSVPTSFEANKCPIND